MGGTRISSAHKRKCNKKSTLSYGIPGTGFSPPGLARELRDHARNHPSLAYMSSSVRSSPTPRIRSNPRASSCNIVRSALPLLMREGWMTMYFFRGAITTRTCSFYQTRRIRALRQNGGSLLWACSCQPQARSLHPTTLAVDS